MRILAHGDSLERYPRMARAAVGLALRGHRVLWSGRTAPPDADAAAPELVGITGGLAAARAEADVVIGGAARVAAVATAGRLVRAHCAVLELEGNEPPGWSVVDHLAWSWIHGSGITGSAGAAQLVSRPGGVTLERVGLWPDGAPSTVPDAAHPDTEILERACERALARHRSLHLRPAAFLDRDGTLVVERGYLSDPADVELLPGVPQALHNLRAAGRPVIVISNQSGVGRGLFPLSRVYEAMARMRQMLRAHGVELDAIYFCPHRPEDACACRKPGTELLERAAEDQLLDLHASALFGDKRLDVETAHRAGARGILVRTGYGREEEARGADARPDHVAESLEAAVEWLLETEGLGAE